ncbi:hypothetical protein Tco_0049245, partial [Tanacetum coccineum]
TKLGYRPRDKDCSRYEKKKGGKVNPRHPAYQRAAPAMGDTGSQGQKDTSLRMRMTWRCPGYVKSKRSMSKILSKYTIPNKETETIKGFMERFKLETGRMKGAPECMRISGFMHGVNNPELTKRLNEHVLKTIEEMMIATTAFIRGEALAAGKKKGHAS